MFNYIVFLPTTIRFSLGRHVSIIVFITLVLTSPLLVFAQAEKNEDLTATVGQSMASTILKITLHENTDAINLYSDGTCSIGDGEKITLNQDNKTWSSIVEKPYLDRLSGLKILEQIKHEVRQSRVEMEIDSDNESKLLVVRNDSTQQISLYSIDMMHATYPKASLLAQFVEVVKLMREVKSACVA